MTKALESDQDDTLVAALKGVCIREKESEREGGREGERERH